MVDVGSARCSGCRHLCAARTISHVISDLSSTDVSKMHKCGKCSRSTHGRIRTTCAIAVGQMKCMTNSHSHFVHTFAYSRTQTHRHCDDVAYFAWRSVAFLLKGLGKIKTKNKNGDG